MQVRVRGKYFSKDSIDKRDSPVLKHAHTMPSGGELAQWGGLLASLCLVFNKRKSLESSKGTKVSLET